MRHFSLSRLIAPLAVAVAFGMAPSAHAADTPVDVYFGSRKIEIGKDRLPTVIDANAADLVLGSGRGRAAEWVAKIYAPSRSIQQVGIDLETMSHPGRGGGEVTDEIHAGSRIAKRNHHPTQRRACLP